MKRDESKLKVGRVVLIKDTLKSETQWRIGCIEGKMIGNDGVVQGYKVRTSNGYLLERPVQLIEDLEVVGESESTTIENKRLNLTLGQQSLSLRGHQENQRKLQRTDLLGWD